MYYGLPGMYGTYRRLRRTVKRRSRAETPESQVAWVWGWVGMAGLFVLAKLFLSLTGGL
jgi:hypothetical protein